MKTTMSKYIVCRKGKKKSNRERKISVEICAVCKKAKKCYSYEEYLKAKIEDEPIVEMKDVDGIEICIPGGLVYRA